jgi:hypothetical protein
MDNKDDLYEILQVHPSADPDIIQAAYRRLVLRYHPDRNNSPEAAEIIRRLNQAYEVLSDPQRRVAYDRSRAERSSSRPTGSAQETYGSQSYSYGWKQWHESLRDSYLARGLRSVFLGAVSSIWGFLLLFVSLFVALAFVSFIWWLSDILYGIGWWPLGALARIAAWLMIAAIALRLVFMVGMGAVVLGRWLWRYADHVVKPKVPVSFGAVFIIVILATSIGIGLYTGFQSNTQTPTPATPSIDGDANASAGELTPTPTLTPRRSVISSFSFGQFYQGRTLVVSVVTMERVPELRYRTVDLQQKVHHYRITPSEEDMELVLMRLKVQNHTATSAIVNVDEQAAELRDFLGNGYFPININGRVQEVDAPENPAEKRTIVFLWNRTFEDGTSKAFELQRGYGIDGWMVFEAPKDTQFRELRWRAGDSLSIEF